MKETKHPTLSLNITTNKYLIEASNLCSFFGRELRNLLTRELGIIMRGEEMRRLMDAFDTNEVGTH